MGGIGLFGFVGIIAGPVMAALAVSVLAIYREIAGATGGDGQGETGAWPQTGGPAIKKSRQ